MRPMVYLCLLLVPCLLLLQEAHAARHGGISLRSQYMALLHWKATLASPPWQMSSWKENTGPCNWTGIMCTAVHHGRRMPWVVTNISLPNADIHGQLGELNFSALPFLAYIDLSNNNLHGALPASISSLTALSVLVLHHNQFIGKIPYEIGGLESLRLLELSFNRLTGHIPPSLGNLTVLTDLLINQNMVSGLIPEEIGRLVNLQTLLELILCHAVTDAGMRFIAHTPCLSNLTLQLCHYITDVGVAELRRAHKLESLVIENCREVSLQTAQGVAKSVHYSRIYSDALRKRIGLGAY